MSSLNEFTVEKTRLTFYMYIYKKKQKKNIRKITVSNSNILEH